MVRSRKENEGKVFRVRAGLTAVTSLVLGGLLVGAWADSADASYRPPAGCTAEVAEGGHELKLVCTTGQQEHRRTIEKTVPAPVGERWVYCRDEWEAWFDYWAFELVPDDSPDWWLEEIRAESSSSRQGFEGRGETEEVSDSTKNLNAQGCKLAGTPPEERSCDEIKQETDALRAKGDAGTLSEQERDALHDFESAGGLVPDECWGTHPSAHYEVTWDSGPKYDLAEVASGNPARVVNTDGWGDRITGWFATFLFGFGKLATQLTLWLVGVAFTFDITEYQMSVAEFAADFDRGLIHVVGNDFSLLEIAWLVLVVVAGVLALKGRGLRGIGEILVSIVLVAIAFTVVGPSSEPLPDGGTDASAFHQEERDGRDGHMASFADLVQKSSTAPLLIANNRSPNEDLNRAGVERLLRQSQSMLHRDFVERPSSYLNWGKEQFDDEVEQAGSPSCAEIYHNILSVANKPKGWPTRYMARHSCLDEAEFNAHITPDRLITAGIVVLFGIMISATVGLAAVTLLLSKFLIAVLFAMLPLAVALAILPGRGRRMAWWWLGTLVQLFLAALCMGFVLALVLFALNLLESSTASFSANERWLTILVVLLTVYMLRKRLVAGAGQVAGQVAARLGGIGSGEPMRPLGSRLPGRGQRQPRPELAGEAGSGGFDLELGDRVAQRASFAGAAGAFMVGKIGANVAIGAAKLVGRTGFWVAGSPYRLVRRRVHENRYQLKYSAWRAAMNDWDDIMVTKRDVKTATSDPDHVTDVAREGSPAKYIQRKEYNAGDGGRPALRNFPRETDVELRRQRIDVGAAMRAVRRGEFGVYYGHGHVGRGQEMAQGISQKMQGRWENRSRTPPARRLSRDEIQADKLHRFQRNVDEALGPQRYYGGIPGGPRGGSAGRGDGRQPGEPERNEGDEGNRGVRRARLEARRQEQERQNLPRDIRAPSPGLQRDLDHLGRELTEKEIRDAEKRVPKQDLREKDMEERGVSKSKREAARNKNLRDMERREKQEKAERRLAWQRRRDFRKDAQREAGLREWRAMEDQEHAEESREAEREFEERQRREEWEDRQRPWDG